MSGAIEVGPDSFLQVGPSLAVSPSHADPVLVHPVPELRHCLARILLAASGLLAGDAVDDSGGPAVHCRVKIVLKNYLTIYPWFLAFKNWP